MVNHAIFVFWKARLYMLKKKTVGTILRVLRQEAGYGIKTVAPKVGISYSYLSKVETNKKAPSTGLIEKLCKFYEADADEIIAKTGALPSDVSEIIKEYGKDAFELLRSTYTDDTKFR